MATYGRVVLGNPTGIPLQVAASGDAEWKVGGITIDWATVTAAGSDTTLADGVVIPSGQKGIALGTVLCKITASGKYGPYASGASDGRQTLARGDCFILNQTVLQNGQTPFAAGATDHPGVFNGGIAWKARIVASAGGDATHPTYTALEAAMPRLRYAQI